MPQQRVSYDPDYYRALAEAQRRREARESAAATAAAEERARRAPVSLEEAVTRRYAGDEAEAEAILAERQGEVQP